MLDSELWVLYALVFGAVLLGVQGLYWSFSHTQREKKAINRRLALSQTLSTPTEVLETLRRERGLGLAGGVQFLARFEDLFLQTGLRIEPAHILLIALGIAAPLFFLFSWWLGWLVGLILAAMLPPAIIYLVFRWVRHKRILQFGMQLPDALDVLVRGLRAGHPFRVAVALVAREMADPIGSEFGIFSDEIAFGLDLTTAADNLVQRVGHEDLSFFAIAINIQDQTGGNLAEILARLSQLVRSRTKLRMKVRALTSEGRLSAIFLSLAPFILIGVITLITPSYFGDIRGHPVIVPAVIVGIFLLAVGNFVMYRMINFKA